MSGKNSKSAKCTIVKSVMILEHKTFRHVPLLNGCWSLLGGPHRGRHKHSGPHSPGPGSRVALQWNTH